MLKIALKKVSPIHHAFTLLFDGGGKETVQLETKTYFYHDLLHFAVESEAKLTDSFYGVEKELKELCKSLGVQ